MSSKKDEYVPSETAQWRNGIISTERKNNVQLAVFRMRSVPLYIIDNRGWTYWWSFASAVAFPFHYPIQLSSVTFYTRI